MLKTLFVWIEFSFSLWYTLNGVDNMEVQTGYLYHIKDDFFDKINHKGLMINHENGHSRPSYLDIKDIKYYGLYH